MALTILNLTKFVLHISLGQIGTLHYHNYLNPDEQVTITCGQVWFTVTARVATRARPDAGDQQQEGHEEEQQEESNEFRTRDIAMPIINTCLAAATIVTLPIGFVVQIPAIAASAAVVNSARIFQAFQWAGTGIGLLSGAAQVVDKKIRPEQNYSCKRRGVYADNKTLFITGGGEEEMVIRFSNELTDVLLDHVAQLAANH